MKALRTVCMVVSLLVNLCLTEAHRAVCRAHGLNDLAGPEKKCDLELCTLELGEKAECCSENFRCLRKSEADLCVYNGTITSQAKNFCRDQFSKCYYCCFDNKCNNKRACENHFIDFQQNALLVFITTVCMFIVALITYTVFAAIRRIRLNKVKELKNKHKILTNNTMTNNQTSRNTEEIDGEDMHTPLNR